MRDYLKKHWFEYVLAFVLTVLVAIVITIKFGYVYATNDDVMMRNIINGNFTGSPDAHVVFISFVMASLWKVLYEVFPDVSWYDWFMVGLHYLCWFLITARLGQCVSHKKHKAIVIAGSMIILVLVDLEYMVILQFTVLSALLASVAVLWMFTRKKEERIDWVIDYLVIFGMLLLSAMLRSEPFLLALPIVGLAMIYDVWKNTDNKSAMMNRIKRMLIYVGVFAFVYFIVGFVNKNAYNDEQWSEFMRSQESRPIIYDYLGVSSYSDYENYYDDLGMDYSDWMAFCMYNCELAEGLDADKMVGVSKIALYDASGESNWFKSSFYNLCMLLFDKQIQPIGIIIIVAWISVFFACYKTDDKKVGMVAVLVWAFYIMVYFVLIKRGRYPERVMYGIYFIQLMCLLGFLSKYIEGICCSIVKKNFWLFSVGGLCLVMIGFSFIYSWRNADSAQNKVIQNAQDWAYVNGYFANNDNARYCIDTNSFVFSTEKLFTDAVESDNMIRMGGWILNSPLQSQRMENQGVENLLQELVEEETYYIVQEDFRDLDWINTICQGKGYDVEAVVVDVIETPGGRSIEVIQMQ